MLGFVRSLVAGILCISLILLDFWSAFAQTPNSAAALLAAKSKDYDKVIQLLGPSVEKLNRENLHLLAEAYSQKGNSLTAIKLYQAALSLHPKDATSKRKIGLEYLKLKKDPEAMVAFREAIELNPKYEPAYLDLALILEKRESGRSTKENRYNTRLLFEDLVKEAGPKPDYISKLCELTTLDAHYEMSKKYCDQGIRLKPRDPKNYVYLATTYKETGDPKKAQAYFTKASDSFSKSDFAQLAMANFYADQKNYLKSYKYYKRATEANSLAMDGWYGLAKSCLEIQKYEEAYQTLAQACKKERAAAAEVRKALSSVKQQGLTPWVSKFDDLLENCGAGAPN